MFPRRRLLILCAACAACAAPVGAFELTITVSSPHLFTANQLAIVNTAAAQAKAMWESAIIGYQPGISIPQVPINIIPTNTGLASASYSGTTTQGGFTLTTSGFVNLNTLEIENFANWQGHGANGLNFIDELIAHEIGHALGIGTLWIANGVYQFNTFQYTGQYGVAAYQQEFDAAATFVPVENAGSAGTQNAHWDQRMRSSPQEGDPTNPWVLDPRVGVVDPYGRDRAFELMTGAIDPDWIEPFLSRTTVQSMRDLGYVVAEFEDFNGDGILDQADRQWLISNIGMTGLQVDSFRFGDVNRDRVVDWEDLRLWEAAAGIPEPSGAALLAAALAVAALRRRM